MQEPMNEPTRLQIGLYVILVLAMLALALRDWNNYTVGIFFDDGVYAVLAQSFSRSVSYGLYFMPPALQASDWPFGLPLFLAPLAAWFPGNYNVLRLVPLGASVLNLSLIFWGWRRLARGFSYWWCLALLTILAVSPLTILFGRVILSEALFLTWSLLAILFAERLASQTSVWDSVGFGVSAVGLAYTRSIGWFMLGALVVYLVIRLRTRGWRPLATAVVSFAAVVGLLVAVTPIQIRDLFPSGYVQIVLNPHPQVTRTVAAAEVPVAPSEQVGTKFLPQLFRNIAVHLDFTDWLPIQMEQQAKRLLASTGLDVLRPVPAILLIALVLVGCRQWYRRSGLAAFWLVTLPYLLVTVIWVWQGSRLFYPVQPQIVFGLMLGAYGLAATVARRLTNRPLSPVLVGVWLGIIVIAELMVDLRSGAWFLPREVGGTVVQWISRETAPDAVVLTLEPTTYYLYAERPYVPVPRTLRTDRDLVQVLRDLHVNYVIAPVSSDIPAETGRSAPNGEQIFIASVREFGDKGLLVQRFVNKQRKVTVYQVDESKVAQER